MGNVTKSSPPPQDVYLTIEEGAILLKVSERTLWELARSGDIPSFKVGK